MEQRHLSYEDMERYLDTTEFSDEYLCWTETVMEHLNECEHCNKLLRRMLMISFVCEEDSMANGLSLLEKESEIRRTLTSLQLEVTAGEARIKELAYRLQMGMMMHVFAYKNDLTERYAVARGECVDEQSEQETVKVRYDEKHIRVKIRCKKEQKATVIITSEDENGKEPMVADAVWSEQESVAVAEFEVTELSEAYSVFVDIV